MAPYLPIVTAMATGSRVAAGLISVGIALAVVAAVLLLSIRKLKFVNAMLNANQPVALLLRYSARRFWLLVSLEIFGFSAAVAAFPVGLLFTDEGAEVAANASPPLRDLFAAVFFVFGLNTNPGDIPPVLPVAIGAGSRRNLHKARHRMDCGQASGIEPAWPLASLHSPDRTRGVQRADRRASLRSHHWHRRS